MIILFNIRLMILELIIVIIEHAFERRPSFLKVNIFIRNYVIWYYGNYYCIYEH